MATYTIDQYALQLDVGALGGRRAQFSLRSAGVVKGWVVFYDDTVPLAAPSMDATGKISLPMPMSRYASVMDLLRNEKPVQLWYNSPTFAGIGCGGEPVGEQEG